MKILNRPEDDKTRRQAVGEWVCLAVWNADAASLLARKATLHPQALYMVQQSMEAATKALARSAGKSHNDIYGHELLNLLFWTQQTVIQDMSAVEYANHMLATYHYKTENYDVIQHLQDVLSLTSPPSKRGQLDNKQKESADRLFESALTAPPKEVELLLDYLDRSEKLVRSVSEHLKPLTNKRLSLDLSLSDRDPTNSLIQQIINQCRIPNRRLHETEIALLEQIEGLIASIVRNQNSGFVVDVDGKQLIRQLGSFLDTQVANLGILTVGALVWPHESYPRYPAPPNAPGSIKDAAKRVAGGKRRLGTKHYTNKLGVIKHITRLTTRAKKTADLLKNAYDSDYLTRAPVDSY